MGFFQKIKNSDLFVILDDVEFQGRRSFQVRNRFLNSNDVEEWFGVSVEKDSYYKKINEVFDWHITSSNNSNIIQLTSSFTDGNEYKGNIPISGSVDLLM